MKTKKYRVANKESCVTCRHIAKDWKGFFNCIERMGGIGGNNDFFANIYSDCCNKFAKRPKEDKIPKYD